MSDGTTSTRRYSRRSEITRRAALAVKFLIHHGRLVIRAKHVVVDLTDMHNANQCSVYISLRLAEEMLPVNNLPADEPWQCLAHVDQPGERTPASYRQTNLAIAQALQETYTDSDGYEDFVAAARCYWLDQLFALMNSEYFEGGWTGAGFGAYFLVNEKEIRCDSSAYSTRSLVAKNRDKWLVLSKQCFQIRV